MRKPIICFVCMVGERGCFLPTKVGTLPATGGRFPTPPWGHFASPHPSPVELTRYLPSLVELTRYLLSLVELTRYLPSLVEGTIYSSSLVEGGMGAECLHRGVFVKHTHARPAGPAARVPT